HPNFRFEITVFDRSYQEKSDAASHALVHDASRLHVFGNTLVPKQPGRHGERSHFGLPETWLSTESFQVNSRSRQQLQLCGVANQSYQVRMIVGVLHERHARPVDDETEHAVKEWRRPAMTASQHSKAGN